MDTIGFNHTRKLGNTIALNKYITVRLRKVYESNSKKEGEKVIVRKTLEISICDGKLT